MHGLAAFANARTNPTMRNQFDRLRNAAGPLVAALAAGNRAMLKLSELVPQTSALFERLVREHFADDEVVVINGDAAAAAEFSSLPFDHLLFTGSTSIGRRVMRAASE